jgi:predicted transcriptional regulator
MNAYDLCQRNVVTVRGHEELATAAWIMRERNVGSLVVVEPYGTQGGWRPVGLLTDRDIVTNVIARDRDPRSVVVSDVMSRPVPVIAGSSVEDVLQRMRTTGGRRVIVIDDRGRLAGILALDDIFEHMSRRVSFAVVPLRPELLRSESRP